MAYSSHLSITVMLAKPQCVTQQQAQDLQTDVTRGQARTRDPGILLSLLPKLKVKYLIPDAGISQNTDLTFLF